MSYKEKIVVVGAGPVGALAALYAAQRGHDVEVYELRPGIYSSSVSHLGWLPCLLSHFIARENMLIPPKTSAIRQRCR